MRTLLLSAVCLFLLSCSKQDVSLVKNTESIQKAVAVPLCVDCEKKYAQIACGDSFHVGPACTVIGNSCRYHTCNAASQREITRALSEKEINEFAKQYADGQVKAALYKKRQKE